MTEESLSRPATKREEFMAKLRARLTPYSQDYEFFISIINTIECLEKEICALSEIAEYVAWCRYVQGPSATTIVLCDSDSPGAFKVYRSAVSATRLKESDPLSPESIIEASATSSIERKVDEAVSVALRYGGVDGDHHKAWVIDQMVRSLTGERYEEFIRRAKDGVEGPETYGWFEGIAP